MLPLAVYFAGAEVGSPLAPSTTAAINASGVKALWFAVKDPVRAHL
jgi:hypothetical protein